MITRHVAALVGSLCKDSFNRRIALEIAALAPLSLKLEIASCRITTRMTTAPILCA
jgi:NAD(P)H-dependent FMN reductase